MQAGLSTGNSWGKAGSNPASRWQASHPQVGAVGAVPFCLHGNECKFNFGSANLGVKSNRPPLLRHPKEEIAKDAHKTVTAEIFACRLIIGIGLTREALNSLAFTSFEMTHETVSTGKTAIVGILFNAETTGFTLTNNTVDTTGPSNC